MSPIRVSLPRFHVRIGLHIVLFEACLAFTRVAACTLARSPYVVTAIRRLQTLRLLHVCSGRFRLERSPGGACTHWKSAALSRRTWIAGLPGLPGPPILCERTFAHRAARIGSDGCIRANTFRLAFSLSASTRAGFASSSLTRLNG